MSDTETILKALHDHREETRQDMHELRGAVVKIADAAADMGKTMARSEERHSNNEEAVKRIGRSLDDHEVRIRDLEASQPLLSNCRKHAQEIEDIKAQLLTGRSSVSGGWKVLTVLGAMALGVAAFGSLLIKVVK